MKPAAIPVLRPARLLRGLAAPGLAPWLVAAALGVSAMLPFMRRPAVPPLAAPLLASAVLLLATGRAWAPRRTLCERFGLASALLLVGQLAAFLIARPWDLALLPLASLGSVAVVQFASAWRFEPDSGQRNWAASCAPGMRRMLGPAFGLALALPPSLAWLASGKDSSGPALLVATFVVLGHLFQSGVDPAPRAATFPRLSSRAGSGV